MFLVLSSCGTDPKTYKAQSSDSFKVDTQDLYDQASQVLQADYVFVMDFGFSMNFNSADATAGGKKKAFLESLSSFRDALKTQNIDYRIGLVKGSVHGNEPDLAAAVSKDFLGGKVIDASMSMAEQDTLFNTLQSIGEPLSENRNLVLESAYQVMQAQKDTFLREGSQLVYIFVSDSDDLSHLEINSNRNESFYANELKSFKSSAAFVSARAIVSNASTDSTCSASVSYGESNGDRIKNTALLVDSDPTSILNHCILTSDFPAALANLAQEITTPVQSFSLQVENVKASSIQVFLNDNPVAQAGTSGANGWTYNQSDNSVSIFPTPSNVDKVELKYEQFYKLSAVPASGSLKVLVNEQEVSENAANGWVYSSTTNSIEFNGTSEPSEGDSVRVSFEAI